MMPRFVWCFVWLVNTLNACYQYGKLNSRGWLHLWKTFEQVTLKSSTEPRTVREDGEMNDVENEQKQSTK